MQVQRLHKLCYRTALAPSQHAPMAQQSSLPQSKAKRKQRAGGGGSVHLQRQWMREGSENQQGRRCLGPISWCTKQDSWCSAANILLLQLQAVFRKVGLLEEGEEAAHLDFLMCPLTLAREALTTGWDSMGAQVSSISGSGGTSAVFGLAAGFPAPCTGPKNILTCPFWSRAQLQTRVFWLS